MRGLGLGFTNPVGIGGLWDVCLWLCCGGVGGVWLGAWYGRVGDVMSDCVVSLDSLWRWQVQASVYCARRIPAHLRCTQCLIIFHLIDI